MALAGAPWNPLDDPCRLFMENHGPMPELSLPEPNSVGNVYLWSKVYIIYTGLGLGSDGSGRVLNTPRRA